MKPQFSLGLLLPLSIAVAGIPNPIPLELSESRMGAVAKAAGDAAVAADPSFVCNVDYTLTVECKSPPSNSSKGMYLVGRLTNISIPGGTFPCTLVITTLDVHNCIPAT